MFSPIRRSSLYFELVRFDIYSLQFANNDVPGTARHMRDVPDTCFTGVQGQLRRRAYGGNAPDCQHHARLYPRSFLMRGHV